MEVIIQKGCLTAKDYNGKLYDIEGMELTRQTTKAKVFYGTDTHFYYCATHEGIKSEAYLLETGKLMLV